MVVPSEKNSDFFKIAMEESNESKGSALDVSSNSEISDKSPSTSVKIFEPDKSEETENNKQVIEEQNVNDSTNKNTLRESEGTDQGHGLTRSSPEPVNEEQIQPCPLAEQEVVAEEEPLPSSEHVQRDVIEANVMMEEVHGEDKDDFDDIRTLDSTLFETLDTSSHHEALDQTPEEAEDDDEDACFKSSNNLSLDDRVEVLVGTPPRQSLPLSSPFLTSTPHSLPPNPRPSSPPSLMSPLASLDPGPMSLPSSNSKSYDYLLKVLLVGDSDVGKQEILSGLEDGSVDSPYCSSTGAGKH